MGAESSHYILFRPPNHPGREDGYPILHLRMLRLRGLKSPATSARARPQHQGSVSPKLRSVVTVKVDSKANFVPGTG